mgnify:CR=1 FL=1
MIDKTIRLALAVLLLVFFISLFIEVNSYYDSLDLVNSSWSFFFFFNTIYVYGILIIVMAIIGVSFYIIDLLLKAIFKIIKGK